jgi:hypothetical protein
MSESLRQRLAELEWRIMVERELDGVTSEEDCRIP